MRALVFIPTYNERENIISLIDQIILFVPSCEILVVDDNSPDGTSAAVSERIKTSKHVHLITRTQNRGRGFSGRDGFIFALSHGYDYVIEMDGDFSHDPKYIPALLEAAKKDDIVIGSRLISGGRIVNRSFFRNVMTQLSNFYIRTILNVKVKDCTSGFRCYRKTVLASIPLGRLTSQGPAILEEMMMAAARRDFTFREIPIVFEDRKKGKSKLNLQTLLKTMLSVLRFRLNPL